MTIKSFFKLLITMILIFTISAMSVFVAYVTTSGGSFLGYEFNSIEQNPYINVLLMGLDKGGTRTDVMILAQLNMVDGEFNMLQIPRDTYMPNNGRFDKKINSAYGVEKEKTVFKEVYDLLGVRVNKHITIDTVGFRDLIDTLGGIDFYVPQDMHHDDPTQNLHIHLTKGQQHLDGDKAEQLVRFRGYPKGDLDRMAVQSDFIQATIDKVFSFQNVTKINELVEDFSKIVKTNFSFNEMLTYVPYIMAIDRTKMQTYPLNCVPQYINGVSYVIADRAANDALISEHFTPSTSSEVTAVELGGNITENSQAVPVGDISAKHSLFNRLTSVDIIDASGGTKDIEYVRAELKKYGYNVMMVTSVSDSGYTGITVVSKKQGKRAAEIAKISGAAEYLFNPAKQTGSDVTVILGN